MQQSKQVQLIIVLVSFGQFMWLLIFGSYVANSTRTHDFDLSIDLQQMVFELLKKML